MKNFTIAVVAFSVAAGIAWKVPSLKADEWDKATEVTFSGPVEIPGQVLLPGTYWFKLLDSSSNRDIVQVYNQDRTKQIAMIMAIPDYRIRPTGKPVITFEERAANTPEAVKAWFTPGDDWGQAFVYPKVRAVQLAKTVNQPVPSMPQNLEPNTKMPVKSATEAPVVALQKAPVKAQQPTGEEVEIASVVQTPPKLVAQNTTPAKTAAPTTTPAHRLPKTASPVPLIGLIGITSLGVGLALRVAAKTVH